MIRNGAPADVEMLREAAYAVLRSDPQSRDAHLRLFEIEQMLGRPDAGVAHLRRALTGSRLMTIPAAGAPAVTVLALYRVAAWEANLPFELVVDEGRTTVHRVYLDDDDDESVVERLELPPHDVVLNAIAESDRAQHVLRLAERLTKRSGAPVINLPSTVATLGRDRVPARFVHSSHVLSPRVERRTPAQLTDRPLDGPIVIRPVGSQAGADLDMIGDAAGLRTYLTAHPHPRYFVMPFIDYRSPDGFYRKYRVMFVNGTPFAYHLAISPRWMIHYYNAPMVDHAWMREEEARFLGDLESVFTGRLRAALAEIAARIPLAYFGIDCGVVPDGRLLLFEADSAMLVHGTDDPALFAYKRAAFGCVQAALAATIAGIAARRIAVES